MCRAQRMLLATIAALSVTMIAASAWYGISFEEPFTPAPVHAAGAESPDPLPDLSMPRQTTVAVTDRRFVDPLMVVNDWGRIIDRKAMVREVKELKKKWKLCGIVRVGTEKVTVEQFQRDEKGEPLKNAEGKWVIEKVEEMHEVWVVFFENNPHCYREGDRFTSTYFKVDKIVFSPDASYIEVVSDLGDLVRLHMESDKRGK